MAEMDPGNSGEGWERKVLEKVALAAITEQRAARRWGMVFKMLILLYLFVVLFVGMGWIKRAGDKSLGKHSALVELRGVIAADSQASADNVTSGLQAAFKDGGELVAGGTVKATILGAGRGDKVLVFKFKRKKQYKKTIGHRQSFTEVKVGDIVI